MLELDNVHFGYAGGPEVLAGISLSVPFRSIVGVVGPSGCGKSTLLSVVAGLLDPSGGAVRMSDIDPQRHPLSMVFQRDTLLPWLTAADNVRLFSKFRTHGKRQRFGRLLHSRRSEQARRELDDRVETLLRMVHLEESSDFYPYKLSGGMRRRLQFLAGVAPHPQMLLLDEPFSSVDEPTRIGIHQDVFDVIRSLDITTLLVTHDLAEAVTLCDRVVILSNRPSRIVKDHAMPFGETRDMLHVRGTREFLDLYGRLWNDLSAEIAASGRTLPIPERREP
jgi:NitT/TauT family transport system ATP-binding protein